MPTVLTTDALVEGVHFERRFSIAEDIGHRALAVNLSDLAAMGARPRVGAAVAGAAGRDLRVEDVERLASTALAALAEPRTGRGDRRQPDAEPGPLVVDVTAVGEIHPRRVLTRSGGRPGDELYVSGTIGGAAAGLEMLRAERPPGCGTRGCVERYRRPEARVRLGRAVGTGAGRARGDGLE